MRTIAKVVWSAMAVALLMTTIALSPPMFTQQQVMTATTGQLIAEQATQTPVTGMVAILTLKSEGVTIAEMKINKSTYTGASPQTIGSGATMPGAKLAHMPPAEAQEPQYHYRA